MADAGQIWERSLSNFGESLGKGIAEMGKRHQQQENLFGKAAELHEMGVIPDKEWNPIAEMHKRHQAINAGRLEALTKLYGAVALTGAKAKLKVEQEAPTIETDSEGRPLRYWKGGVPHAFPLSASEKPAKDKQDAPTKKLNTMLAPYGLTHEDMQNLDESSLQYVDENGDPVKKPKEDQPRTRMERLRGVHHPRPSAEERKPASLDEAIKLGATTVKGQAGDKSFEIPIKGKGQANWQNILQSSKNISGGGDQQAQDHDATLEEARQAIARGAPKDAVTKRLKDMGIDPTGL